VVPEAEDLEPLAFQPSRPRFVVFDLFGMVSAIDFHDHGALVADEIDDETSDWLLAFEFQPIQAMCAKALPEMRFRFGLIGPHLLGVDTKHSFFRTQDGVLRIDRRVQDSPLFVPANCFHFGNNWDLPSNLVVYHGVSWTTA
jgi:hypothetical protein